MTVDQLARLITDVEKRVTALEESMPELPISKSSGGGAKTADPKEPKRER